MKIPETLKMPSLGGLGKRPQDILRNQSIRGFFGLKFSFENCFWNVFSPSDFCQISKIRNAWKLSVPSQAFDMKICKCLGIFVILYNCVKLCKIFWNVTVYSFISKKIIILQNSKHVRTDNVLLNCILHCLALFEDIDFSWN
jgi:hypothetical protein